MKKLLISLSATGVLMGCAATPGSVNVTEAAEGCRKAPVSQGRSIYVCDGGPVNLKSFERALIARADDSIDPKEIGRTFAIPPSEISGIIPASSARSENDEQPEIILVNRRTFAVYRRGASTVFVEQK